MRSIQHFKTLCCAALPLQAAMVAIAGALHDIIASDWNRIGLYDENGAIGAGFAEHPSCIPLIVENLELFFGQDQWWVENGPKLFINNSIGAFLDPSFQKFFERSDLYDTIDRPLGTKHILDSMQPLERGKVGINLIRSRGNRPFEPEDARRLQTLRPWIAHALRAQANQLKLATDCVSNPSVGKAVQQATLILDTRGRTLFRSAGAEYLVSLLGGMDRELRSAPFSSLNDLPASLREVVTSLLRVSRGQAGTVPMASVSTVWGTVTIEAAWLAATSADPAETAPICVHLALQEHAVAYANRVLRGTGATPAQVRVGALLAFGKRKPDIARELGIKLSSVEDAARKLYARLEVHTAGEFSTRLWLAGFT